MAGRGGERRLVGVLVGLLALAWATAAVERATAQLGGGGVITRGVQWFVSSTGIIRPQPGITGVRFPDGSAGAPSVAGITYPTTGWYWETGPALAAAIAGVRRLSVDGDALGQHYATVLLWHRGEFLAGQRVSEPTPAAADGWRLFARKSPTTEKTQLCVIFGSGPPQCFATEP